MFQRSKTCGTLHLPPGLHGACVVRAGQAQPQWELLFRSCRPLRFQEPYIGQPAPRLACVAAQQQQPLAVRQAAGAYKNMHSEGMRDHEHCAVSPWRTARTAMWCAGCRHLHALLHAITLIGTVDGSSVGLLICLSKRCVPPPPQQASGASGARRIGSAGFLGLDLRHL